MVLRVKPEGNLLELNLPDESPYGEDAGMNAWKIYSARRRCDIVVRAGFGLCGAYPYEKGQVFAKDRQESDSEHSLGAISLITVMSKFYPELFRRCHLSVRLSEDEDVGLTCSRITELLLFHDTGETKEGDFPSDGTTDEVAKDVKERKVFLDLISPLAGVKNAFKRLVTDFVMFTAPCTELSVPDFVEYDQHCMQLAKVADKGDALLYALCLEQNKIKTTLDYKLEHFGSISEDDQKAIDATGDSSFAAVLMHHFLRDQHGYHGFSEMVEIARAACVDVRGEFFPWWNQVCFDLGIENPLGKVGNK